MEEKRLLGYSKAKLVPEIGELLASIAGADVSQGRPLEVYPAQAPPGSLRTTFLGAISP
jgi:hypothetical protein